MSLRTLPAAFTPGGGDGQQDSRNRRSQEGSDGSASVITLKPAIRYQFKTGQRDWEECRSGTRQVRTGRAPAPMHLHRQAICTFAETGRVNRFEATGGMVS